MDSQLCETILTGQKLWQLLIESKKLELNGTQLVDVEASVIGVGQGFTSKVLRVNLKWSAEQSSDLPNSMIVKVIGSNALEEAFQDFMGKEAMEKTQGDLLKAHNIECAIYKLDGLSDVVPMPRCFGSTLSVGKEPGIIALEDFSDKGIVLPMTYFVTGIDRNQFDTILDALTNVHAWSVNNTAWRKTIPNLFECNIFETMVESIMPMFPKSKAMFPDLFKDLDEEKFKSYITKERYNEIYGSDPKERYNLPLVLVHGDMHIMNMMFDRKSENEAGDKLIILYDWQISHQGCGLEDVARLLLMGVSAKTRRDLGDHIVKRYVELFNSKIEDAENRITFEDTKKALDEMFAFNGILWSAGMAMSDSFLAAVPFSDAEKQTLKDKMFESSCATFEDAMKLLNW